jgi:uncharacterized protein YecE (DUF72 family)
VPPDSGWKPIHPRLHIGTSSFSDESWVGSFYPAGTKPADYLSRYSERFDTVEIDATFYRIPTAAQARSWASKVPTGFKVAAKVPQVITHEKLLVDCLDDVKAFLGAMDELVRKFDVVTADFVYARWLGDRKGIETKTTTWDKLIVDRSSEMDRWVPALASLLERNIEVYGYFNNHYAGHAPGSIELLRETWRRKLGSE